MFGEMYSKYEGLVQNLSHTLHVMVFIFSVVFKN